MRKKHLYFIGFFGNLFFERGIWIVYLLSINFTMVQVGLLQSVLNITMFLMELPTGYISDRLGRKRALFLGHLFIISYLATFLFFHSFSLLLIGHIFYGIGLTFISGTDESYLYDSLKISGKEKEYGKAIGYYQATVIIALTIAMAIGGYLQAFSWHYLFLYGIVAQVVSLIFVLLLPEIKAQEVDREENTTVEKVSFLAFVNDIKAFFTFNSGRKFLIISFSLFFAISSVLYMFGQNLFTDKGIGAKEISFLYAGIAILEAIASISASKLEKLFSAKVVLFTMMCLSTIFYLLFLFQRLFIIIPAFAMLVILQGIVSPLSSKIINDETPSKFRATLLSIISLFTALLMALVFPFLGFLTKHFSSTHIFSVVGVIALVFSLLTLVLFYRRQKSVATGKKES